MIASGLLRLFLFLFYSLYKDDVFLIREAKHLKQISSVNQDVELKKIFRILRKVLLYLPVRNKCFFLSLTMFSFCGEGATLFFGAASGDNEIPKCHAWVQWQSNEFNSDYGFEGTILWTHSK
jgi:hypothetical protein